MVTSAPVALLHGWVMPVYMYIYMYMCCTYRVLTVAVTRLNGCQMSVVHLRLPYETPELARGLPDGPTPDLKYDGYLPLGLNTRPDSPSSVVVRNLLSSLHHSPSQWPTVDR